MLIILIRTIVLYFIILFVMRVMGKAELSKMSPFQMIVSFMIAELAADAQSFQEIADGEPEPFHFFFVDLAFFDQYAGRPAE